MTDNLDHDALLGRNFRNICKLIHQATAAAQDGLEPNPLEDLLGPDYDFPRMNMLHQTDSDSNIDSSGETDIQQSEAANFIQEQKADNALMDLRRQPKRMTHHL